MRLGIVISGGAAKSIASLGVLDALKEIGLKPDILSGVSGGAIICVMYAAGYQPKEQVKMVIEAGTKSYLKPTWQRGGFFKMSGAANRYRHFLGDRKFEDLDIPVTINATDYRTGEMRYFNSGEIIGPLMASSSIPSIFVPVEFEGNLLLDGAVGDNLPVSPLIGQCDFILGILTPGTLFDPNKYSVKSIAFRTSQLMQYYNSKLRAKDCNYLIEVQGLDKVGMFDIKRAEHIYQIGFDYTLSIKDNILAAVATAKNG